MINFRVAPLLLLFVGLMFATSATLNAQGQKQPQQPQKPKPVDPSTVSDAELKTFAETASELETVQKQYRKDIQQMVTDSGIGMKRFQKIMMSKQNPKKSGGVKMTAKEKKILKELQPKMMKARMGMQQQMQKKIKASDLNMARFREIAITLRQSKELSKRFKQFQQPAGGMGQ